MTDLDRVMYMREMLHHCLWVAGIGMAVILVLSVFHWRRR